MTRRSFLELGAPLLGLSLADIFRSRATAAESVGATASATTAGSQKAVIVFWTHGGMSQQDTYDMKPAAPPEFRGPYQPIATNVPGITVGERFPLQAKVMDRISIVRSVHHENAIHAPSAHWMQTGYFGPTLARIAPQKPSFGSVISRAVGPRAPQIPAYVTMPKSEAFGYQKSVYLGSTYDPFELAADPNAKDFKVPNLSLPKGLALESVQSRRTLLSTFDTLRRDIDKQGVMAGLDGFKSQAIEMVAGDRVRDAFDISREPEALRDRYGRHQYGQCALLARRLVEAGSTCVTVNTGYWDHHDEVHKNLEEHLPPLDRAMATLIEDLSERGMLDNVLVYCAGEFGRTPLINGHAGRDHWSNCFSVMFAGGGLKGGQVVGASERRGGNVLDRPVTPLDLLATIYQTLGISLETHYEDSTGRPISIVGDGKPVHELL
jgi:hypothetical protein